MITNAIDPERALLRHTVATLAYRGAKAVRGAPESFSSFKIGDPPKTPGQILAHIGDLLDWAFTMCEGKQAWNNTEPQSWAAGQRAIPRDARPPRRAHCVRWRRSANQRPARSFRDRSPTRSRMSARSICCAGWRAFRSKARTTTGPRSSPATSVQSRRRRERSFESSGVAEGKLLMSITPLSSDLRGFSKGDLRGYYNGLWGNYNDIR